MNQAMCERLRARAKGPRHKDQKKNHRCGLKEEFAALGKGDFVLERWMVTAAPHSSKQKKHGKPDDGRNRDAQAGTHRLRPTELLHVARIQRDITKIEDGPDGQRAMQKTRDPLVTVAAEKTSRNMPTVELSDR